MFKFNNRRDYFMIEKRFAVDDDEEVMDDE